MRRMKLSSIFLLCLMVLLPLLTTGCKTKVVPPGKVVIVLTASGKTTISSKGSYVAWGRDRVYFVDTKLKSYPEQLQILCDDNINMSVDVKWVGSFAVNDKNIQIIKEKVPANKVEGGEIPGYELSLDQFYKTAMRDIIRAATREAVSPYSTDAVRTNRKKIQALVKDTVLKRFEALGYPISTTDVMISNLDYPEEVTAQRKAIKNAQLEDERQAALAKASIEQAKREAAIAREKGKAKIEIAKADAAANDIRAKSLTPEIIMMRQWDVLENGINLGEGDLMLIPYTMVGKENEAMLRQVVNKMGGAGEVAKQ
jgi:regulator of protease activity HflC (stomatin/prohibitin superfamily)